MHRKTWLLLVATAVAVLSLGVVGCGGDDDEGGAGGDTSATSQGPAADQTLTIAWGAEPPSLDPGKATDTTSSNVLLAIMDPLVKLNPDTHEAEPALAESWDVERQATSRSTCATTARGRTAIRSPLRTSCTRGSGR